MTQNAYGQPDPVTHESPLLFNLHIDPSEKWDVSKENPEVIAQLQGIIKTHKKNAIPAESQLEK